MTITKFTLAAAFAAVMAVSACGVKGDPARPGSDDDPKKQQSTG